MKNPQYLEFIVARWAAIFLVLDAAAASSSIGVERQMDPGGQRLITIASTSKDHHLMTVSRDGRFRPVSTEILPLVRQK